MGDVLGQIKDQRGGFVKLLSKIPGFKGYMEKESRRDADKLVRALPSFSMSNAFPKSSSARYRFPSSDCAKAATCRAA